MKQQANTTIVIAAVVALIVVLGFLAWKTFGSQGQVADLQTIKANQAKKAKD